MGNTRSREPCICQSWRETTGIMQTMTEEVKKEKEGISAEKLPRVLPTKMSLCEKDSRHSLRKTEVMKTEAEELEKEIDEIQTLYQSARVRCCVMMWKRDELIRFAVKNCEKEAVVQWLRENSESESFSKLVVMFDLLKKHIDEEEKKNHRDDVDIIFMAHGSISLPMIPASCLLPLSNIRDVVLYSPWNCVIDADVSYGVATEKIQPQHRVFFCRKKKRCRHLDGNHQPVNLPHYWNSLRKAGGRRIPTIMVSPLQPKDGLLKTHESLTKKHGPPEGNHIILPFLHPGDESVPLSVVTLALSLVLLSSRFKASVHLCACLRDQTGEVKLYENYLKRQYAYAIENTGMTVSDDIFSGT